MQNIDFLIVIASYTSRKITMKPLSHHLQTFLDKYILCLCLLTVIESL